jgi:hypothetical protein
VPAHALLRLQRTAGNRATGAVLARGKAKQKQQKPKPMTFSAKDFKRPNFSTETYRSAVRLHNVQTPGADIDPDDAELARRNLAVPHRFSWKSMRDSTLRFLNREESTADFKRWTNRMLRTGAAAKRKAIRRERRRAADEVETLEISVTGLQEQHEMAVDEDDEEMQGEVEEALEDLNEELRLRQRDVTGLKKVVSHHDDSVKRALDLRRPLIKLVDRIDGSNPPARWEVVDAAAKFLKALNDLAPNVSDLGPHRGVNNPVRERMHLHVEAGSMSPFSETMLEMSPHRVEGVATYGGDILGTTGDIEPIPNFAQWVRDRVAELGTKEVNYKAHPTDRL